MIRIPYLYLLTVFLFFCSPFLAAFPSAQGISTSESSVPDKDTPSEIKRLAKKAHDKGNIRILVELNESLNAEDYSIIKKNRDKKPKVIEYQQKALLEDVQVRNGNGIKRYEHLPFMALSVTEDELKNLHKSARVNEIFEDHVYSPLSHEVSIAQIGADVGWNLGYAGKGQTIVVIDTGVDKSHPYLRNKVIREACISSRIEDKQGIPTVTPRCRGGHTNITGKGTANVRCRVGDIECAHGTFVALIAAGNSGAPGFQGSGVAPEAKIIAIKADSFFVQNASCGSTPAPCVGFYNSDILKALDYVLKIHRRLHVAAVNLSLGGSGECFRDPLRRAVKQLRQARIATIISSGNDGTPYQISSPACIPEAISVGATNPVTHAVSDFSNGARSLDLLAPGEDIAFPYFAIDPSGAEVGLAGTSFSAPFVSGAWAALKSHKPNAKVGEILQILRRTGEGVVDLRNATIKPEIRIDRAHSLLTP